MIDVSAQEGGAPAGRAPLSEPEIRIRVPATSANLGPGFDAYGLALGLYDEVTLRPADATTVEVTGEGAGRVPRTSNHLVLRAFHAGWERWGSGRPHVALLCRNRIPHGRGLGSSAAAVVAGLAAARALAGDDIDDDAVLALATDFEGHPDNAAACLLGGATIAWSGTDHRDLTAVRFLPADEVRVVAFVPERSLATRTARAMLPDSVPHADAARNAGRAALLTLALTSRPDLLLPATEDRLHQHYRAEAMSASADLVARLRAAGYAAVISGAGPTVLVLTTDQSGPWEQFAENFRVLALPVDRGGVSVTAVAASP